ncbi:type VI secretion system baseplate subunit TssG [Arsenophonus apicola]|uniref:Type VI secretion system baseplate subunit TssG n=1 Tax=Arsenophonus apicola TaxID=2879119 RepID=A0ABY8P4H3_9GAMM|nr:type VI secretion system baseplate subunit TssG [Arsenophonus apicola]WGO83916.1 type VI secretion system baseplate subunit TssG [Arsenophonus apicola]
MAMTFSLLGGSFYQNVRRLLSKCLRKGRQVSVPDDVVRFESVLTLDAPEREVESVTVDESMAEETTYCMAVNHFGLLGTHGALPLRYTEWLIDRRYRYGDDSAKAFLDVFNHRLLSLRFQVWQKYRLYVNAELNTKRQLPAVITAVTGLSAEQMASLPAADMSGLLSTSVRSLVNLERLLQREFQLAVKIQPFHGRWRKVASEYQAILGGCRLGEAPVIGQYFCDIQSHFLIQFTCSKPQQWEKFLSNSDVYSQLNQRVGLFTGGILSFSLELLVAFKGSKITLDGQFYLGKHGYLGNEARSAATRLYITPIN